jgi:hypothetical protein
VIAAVLAAALTPSCNANGGGLPGEFAGEGWFQGRVFVCKTPGHCRQLHLPVPTHKAVYVDLRPSRGHAYGSSAMNNDGTFGAYAAPGTYFATLRPAHLLGVRVTTVRVRLTANGRVAFDIAYGRLR